MEEIEAQKFVVELWLDGYESAESHAKACKEFIYDQLNMTASSVKITPLTPTKKEGENE